MAEDPAAAGVPKTTGSTRSYDDGRIRVHWDPTRCIHTGICLFRSPGVFDVTARPWVDLTGAPPEQIAATVRACPTGALRYDGSGVEPERPDRPTTVEVRPNGPLYLRGELRIQAPGGRVITEEYRVALCRCGSSANKPFCDNSHKLLSSPLDAGPTT